MIEPQAHFQFQIQPASGPSPSGAFQTHWLVPATLPYFDGHFPDNPVLPGVAILDGCLEFLKQALQKEVEIQKVQSAKFSGIITPETPLLIEGESTRDQEWHLKWSHRSGMVLADVVLVLALN